VSELHALTRVFRAPLRALLAVPRVFQGGTTPVNGNVVRRGSALGRLVSEDPAMDCCGGASGQRFCRTVGNKLAGPPPPVRFVRTYNYVCTCGNPFRRAQHTLMIPAVLHPCWFTKMRHRVEPACRHVPWRLKRNGLQGWGRKCAYRLAGCIMPEHLGHNARDLAHEP
jgi:hypothetical protein